MFIWLWLGVQQPVPPAKANTDDKIVSPNDRDYFKHGALVRFDKDKFDEVKKVAEENNFKFELIHHKLPGVGHLKVKKPFECSMEYKAALSKFAANKHVLGISPNSEMRIKKE